MSYKIYKTKSGDYAIVQTEYNFEKEHYKNISSYKNIALQNRTRFKTLDEMMQLYYKNIVVKHSVNSVLGAHIYINKLKPVLEFDKLEDIPNLKNLYPELFI